MTRKDELKHWEQMPEPKPSWETFKRMMPQFGSNPLAVQAQWEKRQRKIQSQANSNHNQDL